MYKNIGILLILAAFSLADPVSSFSKENGNKKKTGKKTSSMTMEATKVEGNVEKPEFINIIQRRRVEFEDRGELNTSFKDKIFKPLIKYEFENNFSDKVNKILDDGSIDTK